MAYLFLFIFSFGSGVLGDSVALKWGNFGVTKLGEVCSVLVKGNVSEPGIQQSGEDSTRGGVMRREGDISAKSCEEREELYDGNMKEFRAEFSFLKICGDTVIFSYDVRIGMIMFKIQDIFFIQSSNCPIRYSTRDSMN